MDNAKKKLTLNSKTVRRMTELAVETDLRAGRMRGSDSETCNTCGSCTSECAVARS